MVLGLFTGMHSKHWSKYPWTQEQYQSVRQSNDYHPTIDAFLAAMCASSQASMSPVPAACVNCTWLPNGSFIAAGREAEAAGVWGCLESCTSRAH